MMTSNRPLEDWGKLIGDVPAATAILDRFLHHAEIIQITGKSYRLSHNGAAASKEESQSSQPQDDQQPDAPGPADAKPTKASKPTRRPAEPTTT